MAIKTFKVQISFGDGKPVETTIKAKSGILAHDLALAQNPGARSVRILSVVAVEEETRPAPVVKKRVVPIQRPDLVVETPEDELKPHPLFTDLTFKQVRNYEALDKQYKMKVCWELYYQGHSQKHIAELLGVGKTTVGTWLKIMRSE